VVAYTQLHQNPKAEAGKGVLTEGVISMVVCVSMGRARRWGAEGVVEADGEVVREELLGGTELATGSGNNRRMLPPVGCLRR
jgi:hypothetical protein